MKTFLINLDKNLERLAKCDAQLVNLGVEYERFPGILGKDLPSEEKKRCVNRFLWWCHAGRKVMDGEIGCALSHLKIYDRIQREMLPFVCILEDDVIVDRRFPEQLERVGMWIDPSLPQVVLLSNHNGISGDDGDFIEVARASYTEAYVITLVAAQQIGRANFPLRVAADSWAWFKSHCGIRLYQSFPAVCTQDWSEGFVSDVFTEEDRHHPYHGPLGWMAYISGRLFGKVIDWVVR